VGAPRAKRERLPDLPYDGSRCLKCGANAAAFSSRDLPELMDHLAGRISFDQLVLVGAKRFNGFASTRCYHAPLSGISVCARYDSEESKAARP
jgi:hypothetical protein